MFLDDLNRLNQKAPIHLWRKPCFIGLPGLVSPFNPFIFMLPDDLVERSNLCFRDKQRELRPFGTDRRNPVIRDDHGTNACLHQLEKTHTGSSSTARAYSEFRALRELPVTSLCRLLIYFIGLKMIVARSVLHHDVAFRKAQLHKAFAEWMAKSSSEEKKQVFR